MKTGRKYKVWKGIRKRGLETRGSRTVKHFHFSYAIILVKNLADVVLKFKNKHKDFLTIFSLNKKIWLFWP